MFRRRLTKPGSVAASAYSRRSAIADTAWTAQDRLRSGSEEALKTTGEVVRSPFEQTTYFLRKRVIWPLEDRGETMGAPARAISLAAVVLLAAGAGVVGLIWAAPDGPHKTATAPVAASAAAPLGVAKADAEKAPRPTLHGAAPVFKPADNAVPSEVDPAQAIVKSSPTKSSPAQTSSSAEQSAATLSSAPKAKAAAVDGRPAGPAAISVARDFADAFVRYETGGTDGTVRAAFGTTATPELAKALLRRPPRLPANVKVPKAKVVNIVPAPSHGKVYPLSVSLLRVGVTSELRLDMERLKGKEWRVTNVLG